MVNTKHKDLHKYQQDEDLMPSVNDISRIQNTVTSELLPLIRDELL